MTAELFVGLMSGTSMDAIDAVLVEFEATGCKVAQSHSTPYTTALATRLREVAVNPSVAAPGELGELDVRVARAFAEATAQLITAAGLKIGDIAAIGSHGQTVLHSPSGDYPFSLQLGNPGVLAALSGLTVVADFRNADIALGGQGAPLVPAFHQWAFGDPDEIRGVVNIGGIANVTCIDPRTVTTGYDTGPGNVLLDHWCRAHLPSEFDMAGAWAATGTVDASLLTLLRSDPYFERRPPKSTGSDYFNSDWLHERLRTFGESVEPADVQATLAELTASTIAAALSETRSVAICGGGVFNRDLMRRLERELRPRSVHATSAWGVDPEWVEAIAFAWLARQRLSGNVSNIPSVTGARAKLSLGGVYLPPEI